MTTDKVRDDGFCVQRQCFSAGEVELINRKIGEYIHQPHPGIVREADASLIRGIHGPHLFDGFFSDLISDPRLLGPAEDFLGEPCYVHQFKINMKQRMNGQAWPWHQDYVYWERGDGIRSPRLLNVALLLGEVDMLQGPLCFIPRSHTLGDLSAEPEKTGDWEQDISKDLTYQIGHRPIERLIAANGVEYMTGQGGDLILFDPLMAHCSSTNLSPHDRALLIVTYNAVSNAPVADPGARQRPEFLSARDFTPVQRKTPDYLRAAHGPARQEVEELVTP